jgi:hypothetical protein
MTPTPDLLLARDVEQEELVEEEVLRRGGCQKGEVIRCRAVPL